MSFINISDMQMDVDEEGTKSNDDSVENRSTEILTSDDTPESFEQNSNTSQHNTYDRNGKIGPIFYITCRNYQLNFCVLRVIK